jgi:hypothetical protein
MTDHSHWDLQRRVEQRVNIEGWTLLGGVSMTAVNNKVLFAQALTKTDIPSPDENTSIT